MLGITRTHIYFRNETHHFRFDDLPVEAESDRYILARIGSRFGIDYSRRAQPFLFYRRLNFAVYFAAEQEHQSAQVEPGQ